MNTKMAATCNQIYLPAGFTSKILEHSRKFQDTLVKKKLTILSVSVFNGRFKALSIINNSIHQSWERPGLIVSAETLAEALQEAIQYTQFPGKQVTVLVENQRLITHTIQVPPMPLTDLLPILERKAQQEKTWEGPAAWRYEIGLESRGKLNVRLEIWPQSFVDEIVQICWDLGLDLLQLAPISTLSESQLRTLPVEPEEGTLLVTILEGKITFVAGNDNGTPLLTRHLFPAQDWVPLGERVGTEVNRTIMFITQQTDLSIQKIWFLGEDERLTAGEIQPHVPTPILPFPIEPDWKYWLWIGARLPIHHPRNFTPTAVLLAPLRKVLTTTIAAMIAVFVILGVGTMSGIEGYLTQNQEVVQAMTAQGSALRQDKERWEGRLVRLQTQRQWAQAITEPAGLSLEGIFLGYLGNVVPQKVILQKAFVKRTTEGWDFELAGSTSMDLSTSLQVLDEFVRQLAEGPFHVTIPEDWRDALLTQTTTSSQQGDTGHNHRFTMKGTIS